MKFEEALKTMREGKKVVCEETAGADWYDVFYIKDNRLTSDRYDEGELSEEEVPVMLDDFQVMSEDWEVYDA